MKRKTNPVHPAVHPPTHLSFRSANLPHHNVSPPTLTLHFFLLPSIFALAFRPIIPSPSSRHPHPRPSAATSAGATAIHCVRLRLQFISIIPRDFDWPCTMPTSLESSRPIMAPSVRHFLAQVFARSSPEPLSEPQFLLHRRNTALAHYHPPEPHLVYALHNPALAAAAGHSRSLVALLLLSTSFRPKNSFFSYSAN